MTTRLPLMGMKAHLIQTVQQTIVLLTNGLFSGEAGPTVQQCLKVQGKLFEIFLEEWVNAPESKEHKSYASFKKCYDDIKASKAKEEKETLPSEEGESLNNLEKLRKTREKREAKSDQSKSGGAKKRGRPKGSFRKSIH